MDSQKKKLLITTSFYFILMFFASLLWIDPEKPIIRHVIFAAITSILYCLSAIYVTKYKKS